MIKIFSPKITQSKINISKEVDSLYREQLLQARGVIDNYLKDKKCTVGIKNCPLSGCKYLAVNAINDCKNILSRVSVAKESEQPFLRTIYQAIEFVTKQVTRN